MLFKCDFPEICLWLIEVCRITYSQILSLRHRNFKWNISIHEICVIKILQTSFFDTLKHISLKVINFSTQSKKIILTWREKRTSCYRCANKLLQIWSQAVNKLCSHCLFPVVVTSLEQAVNNLEQAWWHYQTCSEVVLTSLIQSW
jgi:hypothetical protein